MIDAHELIIGQGSTIAPSAKIRGVSGPAKRIVIGDHTYIGEDVQIICNDFSIGDYGKIHHHTNIHGYLPCHIGHNAWVGQYCILDSIGGLTIGHNCGIGAHSQLWSHIKFGDTLEGCRFLSEKPLSIGQDVWFVGHCIVTPITAHNKSMAMVGSVVTKDMAANTIYAGSPAQPISDRIGPQFAAVTIGEKMDKMRHYLTESGADMNQIELVESIETINWDDNRTYFAVNERQYKKTGHPAEVQLMRYLLPEKAKFVPAVRP
jgi:acetyltransferase-like isoleucine patch superfamily enzyme